MQLDVTKQVSAVQNDVNTVKSQNESIASNVNTLKDTIQKLVELNVIHDKPKGSP
jgi:archaellum component FlaC